MRLLDDIVMGATVSSTPIADLLRQCLVLAYKLKNDRLKTWVEHELNGYEYYGEIPSYRVIPGIGKGNFIGGFQQLTAQPIPSVILEEQHRHFCKEARLVQPIAAYETPSGANSFVLNWPADLIALYRDKIIEGMSLHTAWIEVGISALPGLKDVVRTRILTLALEIQAEAPSDTEAAVTQIPPETVDRLVTIHIYNSNVNLGDGGIINANTVIAGDAASLRTALEGLGLAPEAADELQAAIAEDGKTDGLGKKALAWIGKTVKASGKAGLRIGGEVAKATLTAYAMQYLGLTPPVS